MLVRINAGSSGVADYLETGRKRGREFDRELIDDRLVLAGDLALMDAVIESIETAEPGDARYLHITLGFAERFTSADTCAPGEVNLALLHEVTEAYRNALMAAYDPSEYAWYAEAHVPKVTHELHESSGEYVERLPHVHIVLPMRNLEDGRYLNPFGHGKSNLAFNTAIQEQINQRFGLRSPQQSRRGTPHNAIAKHNPRFAPKTPKEIRALAQDLVSGGKAASFDELAEQLRVFGEVRIRAGRDGDYINVKPDWAERGINLKDLGREGFDKAKGSAAAGVASEPFAEQVDQWVGQAAFEARYVNSGNRVRYRKLSKEERKAWLQQKRAATLARLEARSVEWERGGPNDSFINQKDEALNDRRNIFKRGFADARAAWRAANLYQSRTGQASLRKPAETLSGVRELSGVPVVHGLGPPEMLLHPDARDRVVQEGAAGDEVRRARARADRDPREGRGRPLTVAQTLSTARERRRPDPDRLKTDTSPELVLQAAARRFAIKRADYEVGSGRDGAPRILHAGRQYNLGDFFTKHLQRPWEEAREILAECYHATLSDGLPPPDKSLWQSFSSWRERSFQERRAAAAAASAAGRERLGRAREAYRRVHMSSQQLPAKQRAAALAEARAKRLIAHEEHRHLAAQARLAAKPASRNAQYRQFLTELANQGHLGALGELRRAAAPDPTPFEGVLGEKGRAVLPLPTYRVDPQGRVTYYRQERSLVADTSRGVEVLQRAQDAYDTALRVAVARYGRTLSLRGDKIFMANMVAAARRSGMALTIRDASNPRAAAIQIAAPERGR